MHQKTECDDVAAQSCRALIVDDDRVALILLSHIARQGGWSVVEASDLASARAALQMANESGDLFAVVVSDYDLPDGSGLDLLDELTGSNAEDAAPRFVLVTGHQERNEFKDERIERVQQFLVKPVASQELLVALGIRVSP